MNQITKRRSPFSGLTEIHQAIDRLFEPTVFGNENWLSNVLGSNWTPTIDVSDEKDKYVIRADVPGVDPKNIEVTMEKGVITIKGHKETEVKEKHGDYVHLERSQGSFFRSLTLPGITDDSKISAKTKNGVLEIWVPKTAASSSRKIQIKEE